MAEGRSTALTVPGDSTIVVTFHPISIDGVSAWMAFGRRRSQTPLYVIIEGATVEFLKVALLPWIKLGCDILALAPADRIVAALWKWRLRANLRCITVTDRAEWSRGKKINRAGDALVFLLQSQAFTSLNEAQEELKAAVSQRFPVLKKAKKKRRGKTHSNPQGETAPSNPQAETAISTRPMETVLYKSPTKTAPSCCKPPEEKAFSKPPAETLIPNSQTTSVSKYLVSDSTSKNLKIELSAKSSSAIADSRRSRRQRRKGEYDSEDKVVSVDDPPSRTRKVREKGKLLPSTRSYFEVLLEEVEKKGIRSSIQDGVDGLAATAQLSALETESQIPRYRAVVEEMDGDRAIVKFVDIGKSEILSGEKLKPLSPEFYHLPVQATPCRLHGMEDLFAGSEGAQILMLMAQELLNKNFVCQVKRDASSSNDLPTISLETSEGNLLQAMLHYSENMLKRGCGQPASPSSTPVMLESHVSLPNVSPFKETNLVKGGPYKILITLVESPSNFWCQLIQDGKRLKYIMDSLQTLKKTTLRSWPPELHQGLTVRSSIDQVWYRAVVVKSGPAHRVEVLFVDYGHRETIEQHQSAELKKELWDLEAMAFSASLYALRPKNDTWEPATIDAFDAYTSRENLMAYFMGRDVFDRAILDICDTSGKSLSEDLLKKGLVRRVENPSLGGKISSRALSRASIPCMGAQTRSIAPSVCVSSTAPLPMTSSFSYIPPLVSSEEIATDSLYLNRFFHAPIALGSRHVVAFSWIVSLNEFYLHLKSRSQDMNEIVKVIDRLCEGGRDPGPSLTNDAVGSPCVAKYVVDGTWNRGRIEGVFESTSSSDSAYAVRFVDFGNVSRVVKSDLRAAHPNLMTFPVSAIPCRLTGIVAADGDSDSRRVNVSLAMEGACSSDELFCEFLAVDDDFYEVRLEAGGREIAEILCEIGFARKIEEVGATTNNVDDYFVISGAASRSVATASATKASYSPVVAMASSTIEAASFPVVATAALTSVVSTVASATVSPTTKDDAEELLPFDLTSLPPCPLWEEHLSSLSEETTGFPFIRLLLTSVVDANNFYLQCVVDDDGQKFQEFSDAIEEYYETEGLPLQFPRKGSLVAAKFSEDGSWYRGVVEEIRPVSQVKVLYFDFGNSEILPFSSLRALLPDFARFPAQAHLCAFDPDEGDLSELLKSLSIDKEFHCRVTKVEGGKAFVKVVDDVAIAPRKNDVGIGERISIPASTPGAITTLNMPLSAPSPIGLESKIYSSKDFPQCSRSDINNNILNGPISVSVTTSDVINLNRDCGNNTEPTEANRYSSSFGDTNVSSKTKAFPPQTTEKLSEGDVRVFVAFLDADTGDAFLQLSSDVEELERTSTSLSNLKSMAIPFNSLYEGMPLAARFSADRAWYRARIESIDVARRRLFVFFVDYGDSEEKDFDHDEFRILTNELVEEKPPLAYHCHLAVPPLSSEAVKRILSQELTASFSTSTSPMEVVLTCDDGETFGVRRRERNDDKNHGQDASANDLLPGEGFAKLEYPCRDPPQFLTDQTHQVFICYMLDIPDCYLHLVSEAKLLEETMSRLSVANSIGLPFDALFVGLPVAARFSEDGAWYRARIDAVVAEEPRRVRLFYVDYGNEEEVDFDSRNIKSLPNQFLDDLPPFAIRCRLSSSSGIEDDPEALEKEWKATFLSSTLPFNVFLSQAAEEPVCPTEDPVCPADQPCVIETDVEIIQSINQTSNPLSIKPTEGESVERRTSIRLPRPFVEGMKKLIDSNGITEVKVDLSLTNGYASTIMPTPPSRPSTGASDLKEIILPPPDEFQEDEEFIVLENGSRLSESAESGDQVKFFDVQNGVVASLLSPGSIHRVRVTHVTSPSQFWVVPLSLMDEAAAMHERLTAIGARLAPTRAASRLARVAWEPGDFVLCRCDDDDDKVKFGLRRGLVIGVDGDKIVVRLIDFGESRSVMRNDVLPLPTWTADFDRRMEKRDGSHDDDIQHFIQETKKIQSTNALAYKCCLGNSPFFGKADSHRVGVFESIVRDEILTLKVDQVVVPEMKPGVDRSALPDDSLPLYVVRMSASAVDVGKRLEEILTSDEKNRKSASVETNGVDDLERADSDESVEILPETNGIDHMFLKWTEKKETRPNPSEIVEEIRRARSFTAWSGSSVLEPVDMLDPYHLSDVVDMERRFLPPTVKIRAERAGPPEIPLPDPSILNIEDVPLNLHRFFKILEEKRTAHERVDVAKTFPPFRPETEETLVDAVVVAVRSFDEICLRVEAINEREALDRTLRKYYVLNPCKPPKVKSLRVGKSLVLRRAPSTFRRGVVVSHDAKSADLRLIDDGIHHVVSLEGFPNEDLRELPDVLDFVTPRSDPFLAPLCKLLLAPPMEPKPLALLHFMRLTLDKKVQVQFKGSLVEPRCVKIFVDRVDVLKLLHDADSLLGPLPSSVLPYPNRAQIEPEDVNGDWESLPPEPESPSAHDDEVYLSFCRQRAKALENDPVLSKRPNVKRLHSSSNGLFIPRSLSLINGSSSPGSPSSHSSKFRRASPGKVHFGADAKSPERRLGVAPPRFISASVEVDVWKRCFATYVQSPAEFYVQMVEGEKRLSELEKEIKEYCAANDDDVDLRVFASGTPCLAKFCGDGRWYRGEVIQVFKNSGYVEVFFVDFGNRQRMANNSDCLRKIGNPRFLELPTQAILCKLQGLEPPDVGWSRESTSALESLLDDAVSVFIRFSEPVQSGRDSGVFPCARPALVGTKAGVDDLTEIMRTKFSKCQT